MSRPLSELSVGAGAPYHALPNTTDEVGTAHEDYVHPTRKSPFAAVASYRPNETVSNALAPPRNIVLQIAVRIPTTRRGEGYFGSIEGRTCVVEQSFGVLSPV